MAIITETGGTIAPTSPEGSRVRLRVIDAGIGSSGIYPASTIEAAAPLVAPGTPIYADHPTVSEGYERPERSVRDLVGFIEGNGRYVTESHSIEAEASILPKWREALAAMHQHVGMSIRAAADVEEREGKRVIQRITSIESVDLVTKAGRGGKVLELLESARPHITVQETTHTDVMSRLARTVTDVHGPDAMIQDRDDTYVFFTLWSPRPEGGREDRFDYRQAYTTTDTTVTLTGEREPVVRSTEYKPIPGDNDQEEAPVANQNTEAQEASKNSGGGNPFAKNNGGGGETPQDPKDKRIAELEAQVADLKTKLKAAQGGGSKESAQSTEDNGGQVAESSHEDGAETPQGEHPAIDYDQLAEALARRESAQGAGTPRGLGGTPVHESRRDADITDPSAILAALRG
jgi:hypothetical protein